MCGNILENARNCKTTLLIFSSTFFVFSQFSGFIADEIMGYVGIDFVGGFYR